MMLKVGLVLTAGLCEVQALRLFPDASSLLQVRAPRLDALKTKFRVTDAQDTDVEFSWKKYTIIFSWKSIIFCGKFKVFFI